MEHLTKTQFEDYQARRLNGAELLAVADHLAECQSCQRHINGDQNFLAVHSQFFDDTHPVHLTEDQTAAFVDKHLLGEELQLVQDHLSRCEQCVIAVEDLRSFRNEVAPSLDRDLGPTLVVKTPSWWQRTFTVFTNRPAFATAFALLLLVVAGWVIWRAFRQQPPKPEVVEVPSSTPAPAVPAATPEPAKQFVAQLNDGDSLLTLDQQGTLSGAGKLPPAYQARVKQALNGQSIERSTQLEGLTRGRSTLMGSDSPKGTFQIVGPAGVVILSTRPTLNWTKMDGATSYVVEIYDDAFKLVASSEPLTTTTWTPGVLPRGKVYSWQVKATKDGEETTSPKPPAPQARFRILDQKRADEITQARRAYGSSHLAMGLLFADVGLLDDAEREFRLLLRANPNSKLAQNLLRQVQSLQNK